MVQENKYMDLLLLERRLYGVLSEVSDLTNQMAEALDRGDQVSLRLLVSMRQAPIARLAEVKQAESSVSAQESPRGAELLRGAEPAQPDEQALAGQIATNRKLLERIVELDSRLNRKIGGDKSRYAQAIPAGSPLSGETTY